MCAVCRSASIANDRDDLFNGRVRAPWMTTAVTGGRSIQEPQCARNCQMRFSAGIGPASLSPWHWSLFHGRESRERAGSTH